MVFRNEEALRKARDAAPEAEAWERAQPEYIEAVAYVEAMGHEGFAYVSRLKDQLERGEMLTPQQVEQVQRSRKADIRAGALAYRAAQRQAEKVPDVRAYIPPEFQPGRYGVTYGRVMYLVEVEKPTEGIIRGFTKVTISFGLDTEVEGIQYPDPWQEREGYKQWYRGPYPHIVQAMVDNPLRLDENDWRAA